MAYRVEEKLKKKEKKLFQVNGTRMYRKRFAAGAANSNRNCGYNEMKERQRTDKRDIEYKKK